MSYLKSDDNGRVVLHDSHDYMYQVQGNMFITGTSMCHLVIFTLVDLVVVDVPYNGEFVTEMLAKLDSFFSEHYRKVYLRKNLYYH